MKSTEQGIQIKKYIEKEDESQVIVIKENVYFNYSDLSNYKNLFYGLVEDGDIVESEFEDNTWKLDNGYGYKFLNFELEMESRINLILKCYIITKMTGRFVRPDCAHRSLNCAKKALLITNFFNKENLVDFRESIATWSDTEKRCVYYIVEFIRFSGLDGACDYAEVLEKVNIPESRIRLLPKYKSILTFDYILNDFMKSCIISERKKYYPLLLWWRITMIIPLRPIEFSILSKDCCYYDEIEECYFIKVERKKMKFSGVKCKRIETLNRIKTTKEIYDLIQDYISLVDTDNLHYQLLSYELYNKCLNEKYQEMAKSFKVDSDVLVCGQLRLLLQKFFREVVVERYKYKVIEKEESMDSIDDNEIERVQLGDTRHLAFCFMMLQGFNPLTIAQIGGHETLREQMAYQNHIESFVDAHTFVLAKTLKNNILNSFDRSELTEQIREAKLTKEKLGENYYSYRKVEGGRCSSTRFPFDCSEIEHCILCKFFIMGVSITTKMMNDLIKIKDKEIQTKIDCIKNITKSFVIPKSHEQFDLGIQEKLKTNTNNLNTLVHQRAMLQGYRMILNEVNYE